MDEDHELELAVHESLGAALGASSLMKSLPENAVAEAASMVEQGYGCNEQCKHAKTGDTAEVVDVHVGDFSSRGHDRQQSTQMNLSHMSVEAHNTSIHSDQSDLGLGQCFVMPPASPDDVPNYGSMVSRPSPIPILP